MIDTHTHINSQNLEYLKKELIRINNLSYVDKVINIGIDLDTSKNAIAIANNYSKFYCCIGTQPLVQDDETDLLNLYNLSYNKDKIVAIGVKINTQYYLDRQLKNLFISIEIANLLKLPVVIYTNNANLIILDILKRHRPKYGFVLRNSNPSTDDLREIMKMDGYIAIGNNTEKSTLSTAENMPLDYIIFELNSRKTTSNPRGDENSPFKRISEIHHMDAEELEYRLDTNAKRLFQKLK